MRRFIIASLVAAVGVAAVAMPTSASTFSHHFSVVAKGVGGQRTENGFAFKEALLDPFNFSRQVGRDRGKCEFKHRKGHCKVVVHLDGTIGGYGNLVVKGNIGRGERSLLVVNGTGDFNGVAGKVLVHNLPGKYNRLFFSLVR